MIHSEDKFVFFVKLTEKSPDPPTDMTGQTSTGPTSDLMIIKLIINIFVFFPQKRPFRDEDTENVGMKRSMKNP